MCWQWGQGLENGPMGALAEAAVTGAHVPPHTCKAPHRLISRRGARNLQRHHERAHRKASQRRPHTAFKRVGGPVVVFDSKGKNLSLALPTKN